MTYPTTVLAFGMTGQDGSYLAEVVQAKGYETQALIFRRSQFSARCVFSSETP